MYCYNCGKEIVGAGIYCQSCGTKQNLALEKSHDEAVPNQGLYHPTKLTAEPAHKRINNSKVLKIAALIALAAVVLGSVIILVINILPKSQEELSVAELLDLGEKYLLDMNYEQAIVQFLHIIEVEPRNTRAYIGAAEAYIGMSYTNSAIAVLQRGLAALPGNAEISALLMNLTEPPELVEPSPMLLPELTTPPPPSLTPTPAPSTPQPDNGTTTLSAEEAERILQNWLDTHPFSEGLLSAIGQVHEITYNGDEFYMFELWIERDGKHEVIVHKDTGVIYYYRSPRNNEHYEGMLLDEWYELGLV